MLKDDGVYLRHIADAVERITEYLAGVSDDEFRSRRMIQSAVVRELEIVGEASRNLSSQFKATHGEVPWAVIVAMRNRLVHAYFDVDPSIVLEVVRNDLPSLDTFVRRALG